MRKFGSAALFVACLAAAPAASAGDFFINGQLGQIELDGDDFIDDQSSLAQASVGYRWGIGIAQIGLEAGVGKLGDQEGSARSDYFGGYVDHDYTLSSRYGFIGANARIKPPMLPVYFIGRAGFLALEQDLEETAIDYYLDTLPITEYRSAEDSDGATYFGVGVGTSILPLLDIALMYNQYEFTQVEYDSSAGEFQLSRDGRDARSVSLSVEYRF